MDLKSIINSESSNAPTPRPVANQGSPVNQGHQYHQQLQQNSYVSPSSAYHGRRDDGQRQQPPPLQPPPHRDIRSPTRSLSHQSIQSPYTNTPTSSLNGNQYPFPHPPSHPPHGSQGGPHYSQRDRTTTVIAPGTQPYGQPSPSILTPTATTPGSTYGPPQNQRPRSSHSSITPTSAQSHIQNFPRDSPHIAHNQSSSQLPRYPNQHYQSQPGTPLGPPPMISKPNSILHREGSGSYSYDHHRSQSVSSYINPQGVIPSPISEGPSPLTASSPGYNSRQPLPRARSYRTDEDRERSLSVSPKTRLPSQTKLEPLEFAKDSPKVWNGIANLIERNEITQTPPKEMSSSQSAKSNQPNQLYKLIQSHEQPPLSKVMPSIMNEHQGLSHTSSPPPSADMSSAFGPSGATTTTALSSDITSKPLAPLSNNSSLTPTTRKRRRCDEIPIYAQKASRGNPLLPNKRQIIHRIPPSNHNHRQAPEPLPATPKQMQNDTNGHSRVGSEAKLPINQPDELSGPSDHNLLNFQPTDDLTRHITNFILQEVVLRDDIGGLLSGAGPGRDVDLEIEAKLGQLVYKNTDDRLRLPTKTECVLSKDDPNLRVAFKSSMTEAQHHGFNNFLNILFRDSVKLRAATTEPSVLSRTPKWYDHTNERDTFYELNRAGELALPPSIHTFLNPHHKRPKVRITTDQKTNEELRKIVKVRVADLDIYNPNYSFDWRVSVNLEMPWTGEKRDLVEVQEGRAKAPDRNKDRVTYSKRPYQYDLTQVTSAATSPQAEKVHELEIEVDKHEIRKQRQLVREGKINRFDELIRGFVNHVRVVTQYDPRRKGSGGTL